MKYNQASPSKVKAYEDIDFLKTDICRPIRLQLELLKPETVMHEHGIHSTIVMFGSARTPDPETAAHQLRKAEEALRLAPESPQARQELRRAEKQQELSHYYQVAREFAALVSNCNQSSDRCDFVITTGGGGGIMEAGNRGAADVNAKSIGLNISLPFEQMPNPYIPPELTFHFHYFSIRKMHFLMRARALCAFPGGFGTMDELFETLTLIQTRKSIPIPVVLFGRAFWENLINWDYFVEMGLIEEKDLKIFHYCETAEEAWDYIRQFWSQHPEVNGDDTLPV
jgi:uncharacterized protein (TIGR00730 family)